jgi:hypothetical protein
MIADRSPSRLFSRWILVLTVILVAGPVPAEAQFFGLFKKKKPPAPIQLDSVRAHLIDSINKAAAVPTGAVAPSSKGAEGGASQGIGAVQGSGLPPAEQREKDALLLEARGEEQAKDGSKASAQRRTSIYQKILFIDPTDARASLGLMTARQEYDAAVQAEIRAGQESRDARNERNRRVQEAQMFLDSGDWRKAQFQIKTVLDEDPDFPGAKVVQDRIPGVKRKQELKRLLAWLIPVMVAGLALMVLGVRWLVRAKDDRDRKRQEVMDKRAAVIKVVDGIGRGKLMTIDKEKQVFRIGAATGASEEEKNDLILSDSAAAISRFHCAIIRRNGKYFLIDSSLNGTLLNGDLLERGEHHALDDGDELTLADVSRIKFLHT